jgi:shikimate kinase
MNATHIYLVGFMGVGKTSVGQRLAQLLGWTFIDLDTGIEEREGVPIREIFNRRGEPYFRDIERAELVEVSRRENAVVALGGGGFCTDENQSIVKSTGISVWLDVPMELLHARCAGDAKRPLFTTREEMESLYRRRLPHYQKADIHIDIGNLTVDAAAEEIRQRLLDDKVLRA